MYKLVVNQPLIHALTSNDVFKNEKDARQIARLVSK